MLQLPLATDYSRKRAERLSWIPCIITPAGEDAGRVSWLGNISYLRAHGEDNHSTRTELDTERRDGKC